MSSLSTAVADLQQTSSSIRALIAREAAALETLREHASDLGELVMWSEAHGVCTDRCTHPARHAYEIGDLVAVVDSYSPARRIIDHVYPATRMALPVQPWSWSTKRSMVFTGRGEWRNLTVAAGTFRVVYVDHPVDGYRSRTVYALKVAEPDLSFGHAHSIATLRRHAKREDFRVRVRDLDVQLLSPMNDVVHEGNVVTAMAWLTGFDLDMPREEVRS